MIHLNRARGLDLPTRGTQRNSSPLFTDEQSCDYNRTRSICVRRALTLHGTARQVNLDVAIRRGLWRHRNLHEGRNHAWLTLGLSDPFVHQVRVHAVRQSDARNRRPRLAAFGLNLRLQGLGIRPALIRQR